MMARGGPEPFGEGLAAAWPERARLFNALRPVVFLVVLVLAAYALDHTLHLQFVQLGIRPRQLAGLWGVLCAPFVHADIAHCLNNTFALLVLGWCLCYFYARVVLRVLLSVWLLGGAFTWFVGRDSYHIGASGVVYGLAAFLLVSGVLRGRKALAAVALLVVFLFGGLWWGVLPIANGLSWESHLFGGLVGLLLAVLLRKVEASGIAPPPPPCAQDEADGEQPEGPILQHDLGDEDDQPKRASERQPE
jgi:membrane associated rhomboid family serine protease